MNTFAELKEIWTGHCDEAIKSIDNILSTTPNNKEAEDFLTLVNWLLFTNINPYSFLPKEYAEYKYNPSVALELIDKLKYTLLDGDVSFVKMFYDNKLWRVFMIFVDSSNPNFNSYCIKENYWTVDSILYGAESVLRMKEYKLKKSGILCDNYKISTAKDIQFISHKDPKQFIADIELHNTTFNEFGWSAND